MSAQPVASPHPDTPSKADWLSHVDAAAYLGLDPRVLYDYRYRGPGGTRSPPWTKRGKRVYYLRSDLDAWLVALSELQQTRSRARNPRCQKLVDERIARGASDG